MPLFEIYFWVWTFESLPVATSVLAGSASNGLTFQISVEYSRIARSEENLPMRAAL